jgi:hypothetical protein
MKYSRKSTVKPTATSTAVAAWTCTAESGVSDGRGPS